MSVSDQSPESELRKERKFSRCSVCSAFSAGCHFGAVACKACAAFFRRAITDSRAYQCQQNEECPITWTDRTVCRSCRFDKCLAAGMLPERVQKKLDKFGTTSSKTSAIDSGVNLSGESFSSADSSPKKKRKSKDSYKNRKRLNSSATERIMEGLDYYWEEQKREFYRANPERMDDKKHEFPKSTVASHIERQMRLLGMTYEMMEQFFEGYDELSAEQKARVNEQNDMIFPPFEVAYNTSRFFPKHDDNRILYGYDDMVDAGKLDEFFRDDKHPEQSKEIYEPYTQMLLNFIKKFKKLQVTKFEVAAMAGIIFWTEVKTLYPIEIAYKMHDKLAYELTNYCKKEYGEDNYRYGKLLLLRRDAEKLGTVLKENYVMSAFDNKHYDDYYKLSAQFYNIKLEREEDERRWSS
ncbi:unnamed protein product [Bursaphelenchus xylophilus]|uniref:(pine wood nematode) hypothetical protein n=1 Tax=Bursaphelenchus xylophilus TaxID=6326 RepID=A0A7I8XIV1_BURXY|nr:unnamed protein product [Bursaphelenchus xylophilus]CAG9125175.1 unnamed protein product [Bursaphelenchus xylophilus]